MSAQLYPEHYEKALEILNDPSFMSQELALHDYSETTRGLHYGYADDLVARLVGEPTSSYYAYIVTDELKADLMAWERIARNTRYSLVKFFRIKNLILPDILKKLEVAKEEERKFLLRRKDKEEVTIPLVFEGNDFLLVSYDDNYADEFNINGFKVFTTEEWEKWKSSLPENSFEHGFGTNECIEYSSKEEFLATCTVKSITVEQAKMLFEIFGKKTIDHLDWNGRYHNKIIHSTVVDYGMFPTHLSENEDENEDEE